MWSLPDTTHTSGSASLPRVIGNHLDNRGFFTRRKQVELHLYSNLGYLVTSVVAVTKYLKKKLKEGFIWAHS